MEYLVHNHCGHDVTKWDLELIGPNLRLEANATEKVIKGTFQGKKFNEKFGPTMIWVVSIRFLLGLNQ